MATQDREIIARLRAAGVPTSSYTTTLKLLGQNILAGVIRDRSFELTCEDGSMSLVNYLISSRGFDGSGAGVDTVYTPRVPRRGAPPVVRVCAVFAKELVLLRRTVTYMSLTDLAVYSGDSGGAIQFADYGRGYIVVGDLSSVPIRRPGEWDDTQNFLLRHMNLGGGLILGDYGSVPHTKMNGTFVDAIATTFQEVAVE